MSFGIVVLSHTCTLIPHKGEDHQHKLQMESDSASIQLQYAQGYNPSSHATSCMLACMWLHPSPIALLYITGKVLVKNVERKIMYSFIAENDYKFRNCSFNLIKVHTFKQSCSWHRCQRTPNRTGGF